MVFNPYYSLRLAWEFMNESWIEESIKRCMSLNTQPYGFLRFEKADIEDLGPTITTYFINFQEKCQRHRMGIISFYPDIIHDSTVCPPNEHKTCAQNWKKTFSGTMILFVSIQKYFTGREIYDKLCFSEIEGMKDECRRRTLASIEARGVLWKEEEFVRVAVEKIKGFMLMERPKGPRPRPRYVGVSVGSRDSEDS